MTARFITDDAIRDARTAPEEAAEQARELRRRPWTPAEDLRTAAVHQVNAEGHLADLLAQQRQQVERLAQRQACEAAAVADLDQWSAELEDSCQRLADLVAVAESAMLAAAQQAADHDMLVTRVREGLMGHGLTAEEHHDHATAAGKHMGLWLRGTRWAPVFLPAVLARSMARIARAALGAAAATSRQLNGMAKGTQAQCPNSPLSDLFGDAPELSALDYSPRRLVPWAG
ncbi:hypothetical protein [Saccharothrix lopnurensis]|uniref:DUF222 domain-containing protein n=1 Tax=Saccharothrix lopnurensis TaxID=1670621 RepID=A0ABW1P5U0_9PSEU